MLPRPGVRGSWTVTPPKPITAEPQVLTMRAAAKALGISESKLRELERTGEVPVIRIGGLPKVSTQWIRQYIDGLTAAAAAKGEASLRTAAQIKAGRRERAQQGHRS
ncbi:MAG: helix-turn-helix domain-containing protein [Chloroflexota bacterium]|nr:helix-turn-helix domain-containing protein [Chloroflexota bacterium]